MFTLWMLSKHVYNKEMHFLVEQRLKNAHVLQYVGTLAKLTSKRKEYRIIRMSSTLFFLTCAIIMKIRNTDNGRTMYVKAKSEKN